MEGVGKEWGKGGREGLCERIHLQTTDLKRTLGDTVSQPLGRCLGLVKAPKQKVLSCEV